MDKSCVSDDNNEQESPDIFEGFEELSRQASRLSLRGPGEQEDRTSLTFDPEQIQNRFDHIIPETDEEESDIEDISLPSTSRSRKTQFNRILSDSETEDSETEDFEIEDDSSLATSTERRGHVLTPSSDQHDQQELDEIEDVDSKIPDPEQPENHHSSNTNDEDIETQRRTRNKRPQPHQWVKNKRKCNRNLGLEYTKVKGEIQPAKKMRSSCGCRMNCEFSVTEADREVIFNEFWKLGDINRQRELISKLIVVEVDINNNRRRKNKLTYRFKVNDAYVRVCQKFFLKTLNISEKKVRTMLSKEKRSTSGSLSPDQRGHHEPVNKLSEENVNQIRHHLSLLPKVPAHWCRRDSSKVYLEGIRTKQEVYKLYVDYATDNNFRQISDTRYFAELEELNIGFHKPRKDQCWCARFSKLPDEEKAEKQAEYDLHIRRKDAAREQKNLDTAACRNSNIVTTAVFDLEAVLYSPFFKSKELFYRRKLATHNFTIFNLGTNDGYCYIWSEREGKKGSQEISTCLAKFINEEVPNGVETLNFFADNCAGQNKNSIVLAMLGVSIHEYPTLKEINLKFLESGHTYMECDTMHSVIERAARNTPIYAPCDWVRIIRQAKKTGKQYYVHEMHSDAFNNYKELKNRLFPSNLRFTDGTKVTWKSGKWFQVTRKSPRCLLIKNEYWSFFKTVILKHSFKKNQILDNLYDTKLPISRKKYDDLQYFCSTGAIPNKYHRFYENLDYEENVEDEDIEGMGIVP